MQVASTQKTEQEPKPEERKRRGRRIYAGAEIEHAFTVLALADGNSVRAAKQLAADGLNVHPRTLANWAKTSHKDLYLRTKLELVPFLRKARNARYERLARKFAAADDPDNPAEETSE